MNKSLFAAALLAGTLGLSACGQSADKAPVAAPSGIPGMTVSDARMVLNAVPGNPAAVYFNLDYEGDDNLALSRGSVKGATKSMFHDYGMYQGRMQMMDMLPVPMSKGTKLEFKPGGRHLMVMDPPKDLKPGDTAQVTIVVSGGTSQTFPAKVEAAGSES
ncbi:copper chaperone PCu(A)C [Tsuneonella mangrovi]|uniref:copper chaperone PCu(A)C n=1 Tax=Tsuneonella mangrovi TaxID=1982042 RepID=UPI000BA24B47|nr:copper chaperone PCu(A)C [Tsuneonella mangrovi]